MTGWDIKALISLAITIIAVLVLPVNIIHRYSKCDMASVLNQLVSIKLSLYCVTCDPQLEQSLCLKVTELSW